MRIIPVLDLKGGEVVRAQQGRRDLYRPIVTPLSSSSDCIAVAQGLRNLYPFSTFYIADLDAIAGGQPDKGSLTRLHSMDAAPDLWVDAGLCDEAALAAALARPRYFPVLGSESQRDGELLNRFARHPKLILSLDFFADGFHGPASLLDQPHRWPQTVIVMTLGKVGSGAGPDFNRLDDIKARAGNRSVIAAGGIRGAGDIEALASRGIAGALVATSLHDGSLTPAQIALSGG